MAILNVQMEVTKFVAVSKLTLAFYVSMQIVYELKYRKSYKNQLDKGINIEIKMCKHRSG